MRLDLDTYKEILDTITRNKSRSLLTGFGVFWGVFMLIALMGGGQGLKEILQNNFAGFATNTAIIWAQNTTKPYKGFNKGRSWQMEEKDLERLRHRVPELSCPISGITFTLAITSPACTKSPACLQISVMIPLI
jgi:putative ABC transport system permease protein